MKIHVDDTFTSFSRRVAARESLPPLNPQINDGEIKTNSELSCRASCTLHSCVQCVPSAPSTVSSTFVIPVLSRARARALSKRVARFNRGESAIVCRKSQVEWHENQAQAANGGYAQHMIIDAQSCPVKNLFYCRACPPSLPRSPPSITAVTPAEIICR